MSQARPGLAVFDFDGTLTRRDSLPGFLVRACGPLATLRAVAAELPAMLEAIRRDDARDATKAAVLLRALAGADATAVDAVARSYAHHLVERALRDDTRTRLEWHRAQGHVLCIASASLEPYLRVVAERLGVEHLACTRVEVGDDGRLTGRIDGANCRRSEKVARLRALVDVAGYEVWAYGDSKGDTELLAIADHPVWV